MRSGVALAATLALLAGCQKAQPVEQGGNTADAIVEVNPVQRPAPRLSPGQALAAAFTAAFPSGPDEGQGEQKLSFQAKRLVPLSNTRVALVSEGGHDQACHSCLGKLRVMYLDRAGNGFIQTSPVVRADMDGDGFGSPPDWKVDETVKPQELIVIAGFTAQGCTTTITNFYQLDEKAIVWERKKRKTDEEGC